MGPSRHPMQALYSSAACNFPPAFSPQLKEFKARKLRRWDKSWVGRGGDAAKHGDGGNHASSASAGTCVRTSPITNTVQASSHQSASTITLYAVDIVPTCVMLSHLPSFRAQHSCMQGWDRSDNISRLLLPISEYPLPMECVAMTG